MTELISKKIIIMVVMFLVATGGIVYSANFRGDKQQMPEAPNLTVEATDSGELVNESTPSATPEIASVKPHVKATLKPVVTPKPTPTPVVTSGMIDCDLTPYGAGRSYETEDGCRERIRVMLQSGNPGVHCSNTAAGCQTMQLPQQQKPIDLSLPALGGSVDLSVDLPDYQKAVDTFTESVKMSPIPKPCVPVGDGFNCL